MGLCDLFDGGLVLEQVDTRRLSQKSADLVRKLECKKPDRWPTQADALEAKVIEECTVSLREDLSAARVGLVEIRSIGPIGRLFNKRKLLERWGYDQTKFDQLKARTPAA